MSKIDSLDIAVEELPIAFKTEEGSNYYGAVLAVKNREHFNTLAIADPRLRRVCSLVQDMGKNVKLHLLYDENAKLAAMTVMSETVTKPIFVAKELVGKIRIENPMRPGDVVIPQ